MTVRRHSFSIEEFYHLYNRGVDKRFIFLDKSDKERFIRLLYVCNSSERLVYKSIKKLPLDEIIIGKKLVAIGAYCLMDNHFHILIKEVTEGGLVKFMSKLLTAYSKYFNKKYDRSGALFSSEFKATHLDNDEYLKYIFAYIHMNPIKLIDPNWRENYMDFNTTHDFLKEYAFSSYPVYLYLQCEEQLILNRQAFPEYFRNPTEWQKEIKSWLNFDLNTISDSISA